MFSTTVFVSAPIETVIVAGVLVAVCFVVIAKTPEVELAFNVSLAGTVARGELDEIEIFAPALPAGVNSFTVATLLLLPITLAGDSVTLKIGG